MSTYIDCVNCGKQNIVDENHKLTDKCEFGDHPVGVKVKLETTLPETPDDTAKEIHRTSQHRYTKKEKQAILQDFDNIGWDATEKKWHLSRKSMARFLIHRKSPATLKKCQPRDEPPEELTKATLRASKDRPQCAFCPFYWRYEGIKEALRDMMK